MCLQKQTKKFQSTRKKEEEYLVNETYLEAKDHCEFRLGRPTTTKA